MSVVDEIKARLDIVDVVGAYVPLKKAGRTYKGLCPFHSEKTPSFVVNPDRQTWHCFGACGTGGDIFSFMQRVENVDFPEALRMLGERAGVDVRPRTSADQAEDEARQRMYDIHAAAAQLFYNQLLNSPAAGAARAYLERRQVDDTTRDRFQLGYALDSWDALLTALQGRGFSASDMAAAGLAIAREGPPEGGHYDRFRGRLIFPIRDERGRVIGFGGRTLGDATPKYLNSPQTPIFDKGHCLYGLDLAKDAMRRSGMAVVVEGYMDVVSLHQRGFQNVVASLGTALTEHQVALAARHAPTLVLALDADSAGNAATLRGLQVVSRAVATAKRRMPGPGGRLNTVEKRTVEVRISVLPEGLDPDDLVKQNPAEWERRVAASKPAPDYYFSALVADLDLTTPTGKEEAAARLLEVIRDELDSPVEQAHYLQWLARLTRVDERQLTQRFQALGRPGLSRPPTPRAGAPAAPTPRPGWGAGRDFGLEEYVLGLLMQSPSTLADVQVALGEQGLVPLGEADFTAADNQAALAALTSGTAAADVLAEHVARIREGVSRRPPVAEDAVVRETLLTLLRVREQQRKQELAQLGFLLADARNEADQVSASRYEVRVQHVSIELERIRRALFQAQRNVAPVR